MWVHTSSDLAACETALRTCTCHHWRPACQAYIKHNDFSWPGPSGTARRQPWKGPTHRVSPARKGARSEEMLFAHNFCRVFLPGGEEATDVMFLRQPRLAQLFPVHYFAPTSLRTRTCLNTHTHSVSLSRTHTLTHVCAGQLGWRRESTSTLYTRSCSKALSEVADVTFITVEGGCFSDLLRSARPTKSVSSASSSSATAHR